MKIEEGGHYGCPNAYIGPHPEPRHDNIDPAEVASTLYPDVLLGAHVAVLDTLFYTGDQFPEKYRGGMFLALHGSWNRAERIGYEVVFIPFENAEPTSGPESYEKIHESSLPLSDVLREIELHARRSLAVLLDEAPRGTLVFLFSDHGFRENPRWTHTSKHRESRYRHGGASPFEVHHAARHSLSWWGVVAGFRNQHYYTPRLSQHQNHARGTHQDSGFRAR